MIEIRLPKQRLLLDEREIIKLLELRPHIWERALRRGKAAMRQEKELSRQNAIDQANTPKEYRVLHEILVAKDLTERQG